ncbi:MAG: hypothetical protein JW697_05850, partial [Kosmotogaceae bacterium]|nr:hypothetical protein [Kosmotogaceae bacterium]
IHSAAITRIASFFFMPHLLYDDSLTIAHSDGPRFMPPSRTVASPETDGHSYNRRHSTYFFP